MRCFSAIFFLIIAISSTIFAQSSCQPSGSFVFTPTTQNKTIDWQKFPSFSLPFSIVFGGPRFGDTQRLPLKYGFSHLASYNAEVDLPAANRAILWYGVTSSNQPWETIKSPWNNDLNLYKTNWLKELNGFSDIFTDTYHTNVLNADLLVLDIEKQIKTNDSILVLKTNPLVPNSYKSLDNQSFINQYKQDLQNIYAEPINFTRTNVGVPTLKISTYADTPISNTFVNIPGNTWQKWTSDATLLNYLNYDFSKNTIGGNFYPKVDFLTPSAYYYYDYPSPLATEYLAYLLFQIEANRAWSNKKIIPFVWLRYSATGKDYDRHFIQPFMAEATAIFPFFSGADGLWLWDDPTLFNNNESFATYEYFINGLYRLSLQKDMFSGSYTLVIPTPAHDYIDTPKPIWRGVAKGEEILIAAQNPYAADDNATTNLSVNYLNWQQNITLTGRQVFLCRFSTKTLATEETSVNFQVFPNPTADVLTVKFTTNQKDFDLKIIDSQGKNIYAEKVLNDGKEIAKSLKINQLAAGIYIIEVNDGIQKLQKKFIKNE